MFSMEDLRLSSISIRYSYLFSKRGWFFIHTKVLLLLNLFYFYLFMPENIYLKCVNIGLAEV